MRATTERKFGSVSELVLWRCECGAAYGSEDELVIEGEVTKTDSRTVLELHLRCSGCGEEATVATVCLPHNVRLILAIE